MKSLPAFMDPKGIIEAAQKGSSSYSFYLPDDLMDRLQKHCDGASPPIAVSRVVAQLIRAFVDAADSAPTTPTKKT